MKSLHYVYIVLVVFFCSLCAYGADEWINYPYPFPIRSAAPYGTQGVFLATDGGIRYVSPEGEKMYSAAEGLQASSFYAVIRTADDVFAVSEYGLIASLNSDENTWSIISRSFLGNGVKVVPDQAAIADSIMVIAFEDRIAFVDLEHERSVVSIDRIGDIPLATYQPQAIGIHGDSLVVSVGSRVYLRMMDWKALDKDMHLVDPSSWKLLKDNVSILDFAWKNDTLMMYKDNGTRSWNSKGQETSASRRAQQIYLNGKPLKDSILYEGGGFDYCSRIQWIFHRKGSSYYMVGRDLVLYYDGKSYTDLTTFQKFPLQDAIEIAALPLGGAVAVSSDGDLSFTDMESWTEVYETWNGLGNGSIALSVRMRNLATIPDGHMYYHQWGSGSRLYENWGYHPTQAFNPGENSCLDEYGAGFFLSIGATMAPDSSGFLTALPVGDGKYTLLYITTEGEVRCVHGAGSTKAAGPMVARKSEDGREWIVYVGTRDELMAASTGGLDVFHIPAPSQNSGLLSVDHRDTYKGLYGSAPLDMAFNEKTGYMWIVSVNGLGYWTEGQDSVQQPFSTRGLMGVEYSALDLDPHGNIWLGTADNGLFRLHQESLAPDTLSTIHYTMRDGLLHDDVADISIDTYKGVLWVAHSNGVTAYKRNDLRFAGDFMNDNPNIPKPKAYPNPFRLDEHHLVTIDNIGENSVVSIYNRGGNLIRSFAGKEVAGGRAEWDGKTKQGRHVAPGVYYYFVKNSKETHRGKIIVIH